MSEQIVVDSLEFARNGDELHGRMPVANLSRLQDCLYSTEGEVEYSLSGRIGKEGKPFLHCNVKGVLQLTCQRCLGALAFPFDLSSDLELVADQGDIAELGEEHDAHDVIVAEPKLDVVALLEDEILLGLPISPRHAEGECPRSGRPGRDEEGAQSAFQVLAALKHRKV